MTSTTTIIAPIIAEIATVTVCMSRRHQIQRHGARRRHFHRQRHCRDRDRHQCEPSYIMTIATTTTIYHRRGRIVLTIVQVIALRNNNLKLCVFQNGAKQ